MNKNDTLELIELISNTYPNCYLNIDKSRQLNEWSTITSEYDKTDVFKKTKELMATEEYRKTPPTIYYITRALTKVNDKIDFSQRVYYCSQCNRAFNSYEDMLKHEDRCRSVNYVIRNTKKYFNKEYSRKELFDLTDDEFEERYNKLLVNILRVSTNEDEKRNIRYIFNPPVKLDIKININDYK